MRFSLRINNDLPVRDYIALVQAAERAGFDQFWVSNDLFLRSAPIILTAIAGATERIGIGTCILNPYTMHPAEIAMFAATLDEWSGGRFHLGLAAGAAEFLKWVGLAQTAPLDTTRRAIASIRTALQGGRGGDPLWNDDAYLRFNSGIARPIPIYLGAFSPRMLGLAGEIADGVLPLLFPPESYDEVLPLIEAGAARAGRTLGEIDLAACIWCSIALDRTAAEAPLKDKIAYYGHALSPTIWARLGVTREDFDPIERAIMTERNPEKARNLVTDKMLAIGIAGTPRDLIGRLEQLQVRGVRHLSFGPPLGPDPLAAIEIIGREVIPYFR
ncbi:MAG TPA: LLM class flavin-dependent oxidoreductase [Thermomicrobiales bacterium]|jgi:5,10-methylenetetrahydromethanopterin reductase